MKRCFILIVFLLLPGVILSAPDELRIKLAPKIGNTFGEIQCLLKKNYYPNLGLGLRYQRLYSLNSYMSGFETSLTKKSENFVNWAISLDINRNLNNPADSMVNSEWYNNVSPYLYLSRNIKASYYSELKHWIINLKFKKRLTRPNKICLYLWNGLRYQYVEQNLFNPPPNDQYPQIYYEYKALSPFAGLIFNLTPRERMVVDFSAAYMLTFVSEYYDNYYAYTPNHSEFDAYGHGLLTSVKMNVQLKNKFLYIVSSTGIESEFLYTRVSPEIDIVTGSLLYDNALRNIDNVTTLIQFSLYLSFGVDL